MFLQTRKLILEQAGHRVITAITDREITAACEQQPFDVAIIGHTVSPNLKRGIASLIRNHCPAAKILELHPPFQSKGVNDADAWLEVPADVPSQLAERVSELATKPGHHP